MSTAIAKNITFREYRAAEGLNLSWLAQMDVSPKAFKVNAGLPDSVALRLGRLNHLCTLEHDLFQQEGLVWPGGMTRPKTGEPRPTTNKSSSDYKEFKAKHEAAGRSVVDQSDINLCEHIRSGILSHPVASRHLADTQNELSIFWTHPMGVPCKSRIDALSSWSISDLKFMRDITPAKVNRAIVDYGYDSQASFYSDAVFALTGERRPYFIVAAEKKEPFDVVVYELDDAILGLGRQKCNRWMERYVECMESGLWPGISDQKPIKAELGEWAYRELDDGKIYIDGQELAV